MKKDTKLILIVLAGILAIVLLCVFAVQGTQNKAFTLEEQVNTAQSDIRVQEKRRVDLVYNLADCVMQYDKHEAETLTAIVEGRGSSGDIENVATAITAVSEAYPELKANENYKELMNELSITENLIAEYRSNFNKQVIFSGPKTIVLWLDGTKTIVSCGEGDDNDPYAGFCAAVTKRVFGSTSQAKKVLARTRKETSK